MVRAKDISLMQKAAVFLVLLASALCVGAQKAPGGFDLSSYGVRIEPDKRVIAVLAALEMTRSIDPQDNGAKLINTPLSDRGSDFRNKLAADNSAMPDDLRRKISVFVAGYKKKHPAATDAELVSPFISMAYALQPAPDLSDPAVTSDLPGDLLDVLDFAPLVREFYRRSLSAHIDDYVKEYRSNADATLRPSAREMVSELLDYLHTKPRLEFVEKIKTTVKDPGTKKTVQTIEPRIHDRHFTIVPELLAPRGTVDFLNIRDDYYVVVPTEIDLSASEARRAFLRFVIDPLVLEHSKDVEPMREWGKAALAEVQKTNGVVSPDVFLAVSRSLVAAVDVRERQFIAERSATDRARGRIVGMKTDAEKIAVSKELERYKQELADQATLELYEDYQHGSVFSFFFADELKGVEESGFDIAGSMQEILAGFNATKATDRVAATAEPRKRALAARLERKKDQQAAPTTASSLVTTRLLEIENTIKAKDYAKAGADLKTLLTQYPGEPRIYYTMGRLAGLSAVDVTDPDLQQAKLLEAKTAYVNALNSATPATDRALLSLTYVALARIYEFANENEYAIKLYDKALAIGDVRGGGYHEASAGKLRLSKP